MGRFLPREGLRGDHRVTGACNVVYPDDGGVGDTPRCEDQMHPNQGGGEDGPLDPRKAEERWLQSVRTWMW